MTQETPAAGTPAPAAPAPAAPAAAPEVDSLIPAAPAVDPKAPVAPVVDTSKPEVKVDPTALTAEQIAAKEAAATAWHYADGVLGKGAMPAWYKADKYKTVEEQAKAYPELEKRLGAFKGAPKDGAYQFKMPDGLAVTLVEDHPLLSDFQKWAGDRQLSQEGYQELLGMLAQYEAAQVPNLGEIKASLGDNADARITAVAQWAQANMKPEEYQLMREATTGQNAGAVFKVLEAAIAKSKQLPMPKAGADVSVAPVGQAALDAMMAKKGPDGKALYFTDAKYRAEVEEKSRDFFKAQSAA